MGVLQETVALLRALAERLKVKLSLLQHGADDVFRVERLGYKLLQVACIEV